MKTPFDYLTVDSNNFTLADAYKLGYKHAKEDIIQSEKPESPMYLGGRGQWELKHDKVKSADDFCVKYLPTYAKKYPITMRVSKEEWDFLLAKRGAMLEKPDESSKSRLLRDEELEIASAQPSYISLLINQGIQNALQSQRDLTASIVRAEVIKELWESPKEGNHLICKAKLAEKDAEYNSAVKRASEELADVHKRDKEQALEKKEVECQEAKNKLTFELGKVAKDACQQRVERIIKETEQLWKPQHHNLCYGIIDPHPDCVCCKWQALKKEQGIE